MPCVPCFLFACTDLSTTRQGSSVCAEPLFQLRPYIRPFRGEDREIDRIAEIALGHPHVPAQGSFLPGAELDEGGARAGVLRVGLELDAVVARGKGVPEQQVLGLGVHRAPANLGRVPGEADLHPRVVGRDVEIGGRAYDRAIGQAAHDEGHQPSGLVLGHHPGQARLEALHRDIGPGLRIGGGREQPLAVALVQRLQRDEAAGERARAERGYRRHEASGRVSMRGACPQSAMKLRRSAAVTAMVRSLRSGRKLIGSCLSIASSSTTRTLFPGSLISENGVTDPGGTPSTAIRSSPEPKEKRGEASCRDSAFRSRRKSSRSTTSHRPPFLSLRNRFLVCPPGWLAFTTAASSTVKTGTCS